MESSHFDIQLQQEHLSEQLLHVGSYFVVEKVKHEHRWEVRKSVQEHSRMHPVYRESLRREFEIGSQLQHPNICAYYRLTNEDGFLYREFIDGFTWNAFFTTYLEEKSKVTDYIVQLMEAIQFMHNKGIVHMDIKSSNILINDDIKTVKMIDFGHAVYLNDTLWRGGENYALSGENRIHVVQDWRAFFNLLLELKPHLSLGNRWKINAIHQSFMRKNERVDLQFAKSVLYKKKIPHQFLVFFSAALFGIALLFWVLPNTDTTNPPIRTSSKLNKTREKTTKLQRQKQHISQKKTPLVETKSNPRSQKNLSSKDSLFLVNKAREFVPAFEQKLKLYPNPSMKVQLFKNMVKEYMSNFDQFEELKHLDSLQLKKARQLYEFQLSKSLNENLHLF